MSKMQQHNLHNIKRNFEKKTGTRLLPYADNTNSDNPQRKHHPMMALVSTLLCVVILGGGLQIAFPYLQDVFMTSNPADSVPSLSESQAPSNNEGTENLDETKPTEDLSIEDYNLQIARESNGKELTQTIVIDENNTLQIDAIVNTSNVKRISSYAYIPATITDEQRTAMFEAYFGERADEVYHYTYANADCWLLKNEHEYYQYGYSRQQSPVDQQICFLYNRKTNYFDNHLLLSCDEASASLETVLAYCEPIVKALVPKETYEPYIIRPYECQDPSPWGFYRITYRRVLDGMPVITNYDIMFLSTETEAFEIKWTLYSVEESELSQEIITVEEALQKLAEKVSNSDDIKLQNQLQNVLQNVQQPDGELVVKEITMEYVLLPGTNGNGELVPVWRFLIGENDEQRRMYGDTVIAINAVTGEMIATQRGRNQ